MIVTGLRGQSLDVGALVDSLRHPGAGALVVFEGTTRATSDHGDVVALDYEAYESRAEAQLREFAEAAVAQWKLHGAIAVHRVGSVLPAETGVVVAVSSGHRAEAFEACRFLIDRIKAEAAIWKKELFADGAGRWVEA